MATSNRRPPERTRTLTHEGAPAVQPGVFPELELTAASTYLGEDTFYEKRNVRADRLVKLTEQAIARNPGRTARLIAKVRQDYKIRHAALLMAITYVRSGGPDARQVVDSVIQRPDEPAELLAIWQSRYGGGSRLLAGKRPLAQLPWALRRGIADGLTRQLTERNYLKYGLGRGKLVTMADAIELTHPKPKAGWQSDLARYILDEAHHGDGMADVAAQVPTTLPMIWASRHLGIVSEDQRRSVLRERGAEGMADAGYTWERLAGWLPGGMDAEAWEAVIPNMGVMALLRNLRNFDEAKVGNAGYEAAVAKLVDPEQVAKSRVFPYRVYAAYREAPSDRWRWPLATTLGLACGSVPAWDRTLFVVDVSGSMDGKLSAKGTVTRYEVAATMATAAVERSTNSDLVVFGTHSRPVSAGARSPLAVVEEIAANTDVGRWSLRRGFSPPTGRDWGLGSGTYGHTAIARHFDLDRHDRVVIFTDDQMHDSASLSKDVPTIVYFNLAGYAPQSDWAKGRIHVGGFSDATFLAAAELSEAPF